MIIEKTARQLQPGDTLLNNGATIEQAVVCHHGASVYLRALREDGTTQVDTVPAGLNIPIWKPDLDK